MKLYLVQHGEAVSKQEDPERPLSEQGVEDVRAMAVFLKAAGIRAVRVWHSGKRRAEQTAELLAAAVLPGGRPEAIREINPNDSVQDFIADADVWDEDTLVVGHLPFMSRLVSLLISGDSGQAIVSYQPGAVACLERLPSQRWVLNWMQRPGLLQS